MAPGEPDFTTRAPTRYAYPRVPPGTVWQRFRLSNWNSGRNSEPSSRHLAAGESGDHVPRVHCVQVPLVPGDPSTCTRYRFVPPTDATVPVIAVSHAVLHCCQWREFLGAFPKIVSQFPSRHLIELADVLNVLNPKLDTNIILL
eukprot:175524-Rhodomonas_salina.1